MRFLSILIVAVILLGCKKKEPPKPPESVQLVFPEKNSECTTGEDINATTSQVEFRWGASSNTETYELIVTNLENGNKQDVTVTTTSAKLPIAKGTPYSWVVISKNSAVLQTASSPSWNFYNSGFETTYAPFPAEIVEPKMGASAFKDINNDVVLRWSGADVDDDIIGFELFLSTETPPETSISTPGPDATDTKVSVVANTVYYWRVITKDSEGNTSDSGIFEFRAL
ncbi:hypothetical protein FEE95_03200 [Maribacter algarum]|uniref:Fibronectin type-III domain-containing protein n=1 Tax=Maribacter algarum (ex Zhang et al. 2020) TaxID=2578118 RepID=A0A5S3PTW8_9FLAO|nr:hypothetical protein [Maribacter algarum]TMM58451.1 hypothetical protein FEE95_03200 [Maribacter algarum]